MISGGVRPLKVGYQEAMLGCPGLWNITTWGRRGLPKCGRCESWVWCCGKISMRRRASSDWPGSPWGAPYKCRVRPLEAPRRAVRHSDDHPMEWPESVRSVLAAWRHAWLHSDWVARWASGSRRTSCYAKDSQITTLLHSGSLPSLVSSLQQRPLVELYKGMCCLLTIARDSCAPILPYQYAWTECTPILLYWGTCMYICDYQVMCIRSGS